MECVEIGVVPVRREYYFSDEGLEVDRNCGFGCTCGAVYPSRTALPDLQLAIDDVLCFNDSAKQGISGRGCAGRVIQNGPDRWIFEIDARLKEVRRQP